ncbi:MAG: ECF transporter S component [Bacillota bacterium]
MASVQTKNLVYSGLLIALSVIGSYVKLGPWSIGLDSTAGFLAALTLGPAAGALVCAIGHLAVAMVTGFPLTPVFHLAVAVAMAGVGAAGGLVVKRFGPLAAAVTMVLLNGAAAPALLALLPNPMGLGLFAALVAPLTLAAAVNAGAALLVYGMLSKVRVLKP